MTARGDDHRVPNPQNRTPDDVRAEVAAYIEAHAGTPAGSVRAIARKFGLGKATIGVIADDYGLGDAWAKGAERTQAATDTRKVHLQHQRSLIQEDLLDQVAELSTRFHDDVVHLHVIEVAPEDRDVDEETGFLKLERVEKTVLPPGPAEWRATAGAIASLTRAALDIARHDKGDEGTGQAIGLLDRFEKGLREAREARERAKAEAAAAEAEAAEGT